MSVPEEGSSGEHQAEFEIDDVIAEPALGAPVEVGWRQAPKPGPGPPDDARRQTATEAGEALSERERTRGDEEPSDA